MATGTARTFGWADELIVETKAAKVLGRADILASCEALKDKMFLVSNTPADYQANRVQLDAIGDALASVAGVDPRDVPYSGPFVAPWINGLAANDPIKAGKGITEELARAATNAIDDAIAGIKLLFWIAVGVAGYLVYRHFKGTK